MSGTNRGGGRGEYWGRRTRGYCAPGRDSKRIVAKIERREAKEECEYEPPEDHQCVSCGSIIVDGGDLCPHCEDQFYSADVCAECGEEKNPFIYSCLCEDCNKKLDARLADLIEGDELDGDY